MKTLSVTEGK